MGEERHPDIIWKRWLCSVKNNHDWQPLRGYTTITFRVCTKCGDTGWVV